MKITPKVLAKDIKRYLVQGIKLDVIKSGALEQGVPEEKWELALNILLKKAKFKKRLLFFTKLLQYFFVSMVLFHAYLWWEFSHKEIQMVTSFTDFIKQRPPIVAFTEVYNSKKIKVIDRDTKIYSDLDRLSLYITSENKKNVKSFEIFFGPNGSVQKNRAFFVDNGVSKTIEILDTGAFEYDNRHTFIKENILWIRVLQGIPTDKIIKMFGKSIRTISLVLEKHEKSEKDNLLAKLEVIYEEDHNFKSTHLYFDKKGKIIKGRGQLLLLFPDAVATETEFETETETETESINTESKESESPASESKDTEPQVINTKSSDSTNE